MPRREVVVAALCGLNLVALPWAYAGYTVGAQVGSAAVAALAFAFLFLPVGYDERRSALPHESLARLRRCVPFYCGAALIALFLAQGFNPAMEIVFDGGDWLAIPREPLPGLPSGVDAPFERFEAPGGMNAFRTALIAVSPWLTFCALWCGVRSRRVALALAGVVAGSGALAAVFAAAMRVSGAAAPLGVLPASGASAYGPFFYQNQAGAFFVLVALLAVTTALTLRVRSGGARSGWHTPLFAASAACLAAVPLSGGFGASLAALLALPVVAAAAWCCRHREDTGDAPASRLRAWVVATLVLLVPVAFVAYADFGGFVRKLEYKRMLVRTESLDDRAPIRAATLRMYADGSALWGRGAGSYRWISPPYFAADPAFCDPSGVPDRRASHAHGDWFQMLAEWGIAGLAAVVVAGGWVAFRARRALTRDGAPLWPLAAGLVLFSLHAGMDCLLFNPAVATLVAFAAYLCGVLVVKSSHETA